jgi:hypothetical protein
MLSLFIAPARKDGQPKPKLANSTGWRWLTMHYLTGCAVFQCVEYSGRKIIESLGNVTVRGEKWKEQGGRVLPNSLSEHV